MVSKDDGRTWSICEAYGAVYHRTEIDGQYGLASCSCGARAFASTTGYVCEECGVEYAAFDDARICEAGH